MTIETILKRAKQSAWFAFIIYGFIGLWGPAFKEYRYFFVFYFLIVRLVVAFIEWFRSVKADG